MNKLISIIIPTYNSGQYIEKAILSVLNQTYSHKEIIVVDDGSTDNTKEKIENYIRNGEIKYIRKTNNGPSSARNKGIKDSAGEYIAFLDADDSWIDPNKLQKQLSFLENNREYGLIGSNAVITDNKGRIIGKSDFKQSDVEIKSMLLRANQFFQSSILMKKEAIEKVGYYNENFVSFEDYDLWLRVGIKYKLHNLKDFCIAYRINSEGLSATRSFEQKKGCFSLVIKYRNYYPSRIKAILINFLVFFLPLKLLIWKKRLFGF